MVLRGCVASTLSVTHLSWRPGTGNQSAAALSTHAVGPAPTTMNGLSAAFNVASLFNDKFGNVWISPPDHIPVQWCSQRAVATPPCFVNRQPLGRCVRVHGEEEGAERSYSHL